MKRLLIIVEGPTEKRFVENVLRPYFASKGIYADLQCIIVKHSGGGLSKYSLFKKDVTSVLYESDAIVSTLIDFYGLPSDFPGYKGAMTLSAHRQQVAFIEEKIKEDIEHTQKRTFNNFIPYIQLHEFEALVFSSQEGIKDWFDEKDIDAKQLQAEYRNFNNPEEINNSPNTAPSKRLMKIIPGYHKTVDGVGILQMIGMEKFLDKCPRFREWVEKLETALLD